MNNVNADTDTLALQPHGLVHLSVLVIMVIFINKNKIYIL